MDDEIPEHGDSHASSSHEASLEPILKMYQCRRRIVFKRINQVSTDMYHVVGLDTLTLFGVFEERA